MNYISKYKSLIFVNHKTGCWVWRNCASWNRPHIEINSKIIYIYRLFYEQIKGKITDGYDIDHLCKNKFCIFPGHLEAVTKTVNSRRSNGTKLNMNLARMIRMDYATGNYNQWQLMAKYRTDQGTISKVVNNKIWKEYEE